MVENNQEEPFFGFIWLEPLFIADGFTFPSIFDDIYSLNAYPYIWLRDKKGKKFREMIVNAPANFPVNSIIFNLKYTKEYRA